MMVSLEHGQTAAFGVVPQSDNTRATGLSRGQQRGAAVECQGGNLP